MFFCYLYTFIIVVQDRSYEIITGGVRGSGSDNVTQYFSTLPWRRLITFGACFSVIASLKLSIQTSPSIIRCSQRVTCECPVNVITNHCIISQLVVNPTGNRVISKGEPSAVAMEKHAVVLTGRSIS
ncbi:hypothetical protein, unlikely [Trypanosoma brucei gambiense DAL972]|uniref:Uncharacterized protein n=1 Tax=Trypanosoma brucei gambiense (strain MHOM/CI/86/DAL972) TaxID=679716 RepID=C9ZT27_TRYB9|nr:hypothetical protein, unlikely [Trypanosoma brucei gambiense DAL972]CBH12562.1 hypothetical protein, unlikely [Trypanosoma brucei gambiense DAL972]|eukprot:XP_011774842.1 hypothetical protein, unlikely [Trypanosoma brucei gambiense DAL972]